MSDSRIRVCVDAIMHATEREDAVIGAFERLGIDAKSVKRTRTSGHFGNPIVMLRAVLTGRDARAVAVLLGAAFGWETRHAAASGVESCTSDSGLHIRLDKQELVADKIVRTHNGSIRVQITRPVFGNQRAADAYADLFAA